MHVKAYIDAHGGDYNALMEQYDSQSLGSWRIDACRTKIIEIESRGLDPDPNHDPGSSSHGFAPEQKSNYEAAWNDWEGLSKSDQQKLRETQLAYKAAFQLFLERTEFDGNDRQNKEVILFRTESDGVVPKTVQNGDTYTPDHVGPAESYSLIRTFVLNGANGTIMRVPYPRIQAGYLWERKPNEDLFLGDKENEFNADTGGIPRMYVGRVESGFEIADYHKQLPH